MNLRLNQAVIEKVLVFLFLFFCFFSFGQNDRSDIDDKYKWDLTGVYGSDEEWKEAKLKFSNKLSGIEEFRETVTTSAQNLLEVKKHLSSLQKEYYCLSYYSTMNYVIDTRNMEYASMSYELDQLYTDFNTRASFVEPEILLVDWEVIRSYIDEEPELKDYEMELKKLFRQKEYTLSENEEKIISLSELVLGSPSSIYHTFKDAEMPSPEVILSNGEMVMLDIPGFLKYRTIANRVDRQLVSETFWENFKKYEASYGEMLYGHIKSDVFRSTARDYRSSLEESLFPNNIPVEVYHSLISNVNENLPAFHRYLTIKKRMLEVDSLKYFDLYVTAVKNIDLKYNFDEAQRVITESLKPLGEEYVSTVQRAFQERWIDVYPSPGKRSGAIAGGSLYDGHPFILLNYNGLFSDVSTTTHELGHAMHSYFSNKNQPFPIAEPDLFVAEVASTFNEFLLLNYMKNTVNNDDVKLSFLVKWLDFFKTALFRQTQFAEFELKIHEEVEAGKALTGRSLSKIYMDILKRYYGHDKGICYIDDYVDMEWAYLPHFYYNFYVYQYSTSFVASLTLMERIINQEENALENYITFLSTGSSDYPVNLLRNAGIDITHPGVYGETFKSMNKVMDEIEKILDRKGI